MRMTKDPVCKMDIDERQTNFNSEYLRTGFQVALVSAEHLTYREFLGGIPEVTYLGSCKLAPFSIHGLIQLDLVVAFLLIDVLLERRRYWPAPSARNYGDRGTGVGDGDAHNMPGAAVGLARPGTRVSVRTAAKAWPGSTTNASGRKNALSELRSHDEGLSWDHERRGTDGDFECVTAEAFGCASPILHPTRLAGFSKPPTKGVAWVPLPAGTGLDSVGLVGGGRWFIARENFSAQPARGKCGRTVCW